MAKNTADQGKRGPEARPTRRPGPAEQPAEPGITSASDPDVLATVEAGGFTERDPGVRSDDDGDPEAPPIDVEQLGSRYLETTTEAPAREPHEDEISPEEPLDEVLEDLEPQASQSLQPSQAEAARELPGGRRRDDSTH